jgi:soluble lytic murein transglycosylase
MTISVTGPDGSTFNFPDETSRGTISSALSKHYGDVDKAPRELSGLENLKRKAGVALRGFAPGVVSGAGFAGGAALGAQVGLLGGPLAPVTVPVAGLIGGLGGSYLANKLSKDAVQKKLDELGVPKAETEGERLLQTGAETAANVLTPVGAGKALLKAGAEKAGKFLATAPKTQLLAAEAGALTSEATGDEIEGLKAGIGVPLVLGALGKFKGAAPKRIEIKKESTDLYKKALDSNFKISAEKFDTLANNLDTTIRDAYSPILHPQITPILNYIKNEKKSGKTLKELELIRRSISDVTEAAFKAQDKSAGRVGRLALKEIDKFFKDQTDPAVTNLLKARNLASKNIRIGDIEEILRASKDINNPDYIVQKFTQIVKNPYKFNKYSSNQKKIIKSIVSNPLQSFGELAPSLSGFGIARGPAYAAGAIVSPVLASGVAATSLAARALANRNRKQKIQALMDSIAGGGKFDENVLISPGIAGAKGALAPNDQEQPQSAPVDTSSIDSQQSEDAAIDPTFEKMLKIESATGQFDKKGKTVLSPMGAVGAAQIMEDTAPEAAALAGLEYDRDRLYRDEEYNKALGVAYYEMLLKEFGDPILAAAAYNGGIGRLKTAIKKSESSGKPWISFMKPETQQYVAKLMPKQVSANTYAAGGPVYTHPAISSIRAKRAVGRMAS